MTPSLCFRRRTAKKLSAVPWHGYRRGTPKSSTSCTTTGSGQRGRRGHGPQCGYGEDPHVLRAQEAGGIRGGSVAAGACRRRPDAGIAFSIFWHPSVRRTWSQSGGHTRVRIPRGHHLGDAWGPRQILVAVLPKLQHPQLASVRVLAWLGPFRAVRLQIPARSGLGVSAGAFDSLDEPTSPLFECAQ